MSTELSTVPTDSACRSVAATDSACRSVAASLVSSILSTSTTNAVIKARTGLWNVSERSKTAPSPSLTTFKFVKSPTVISHSVDMNMVPSTSSKIFSFAEDKRLYELIEKGEQDWAVISKALGRTEYEVFYRWNRELQPAMKEHADRLTDSDVISATQGEKGVALEMQALLMFAIERGVDLVKWFTPDDEKEALLAFIVVGGKKDLLLTKDAFSGKLIGLGLGLGAGQDQETQEQIASAISKGSVDTCSRKLNCDSGSPHPINGSDCISLRAIFEVSKVEASLTSTATTADAAAPGSAAGGGREDGRGREEEGDEEFVIVELPS